MSRRDETAISPPAAMVREIKAAVRADELANTREAVRDALRRLVAEGRISGAPVDGERALKRLRAKHAVLAAGKGRRAAIGRRPTPPRRRATFRKA